MEIVLTKANGGLVPADQQAAAYIEKLRLGAGIKAKVTQQRNPRFHRKFMALLNIAFDAWEPEQKFYKGQAVMKNFGQFRNDVTVLAGFYESTVTLKGDIRVTAKSISFAKMEQHEFEDLYNAVVQVILSRILTNYSRDDLDRVVDNILSFC